MVGTHRPVVGGAPVPHLRPELPRAPALLRLRRRPLTLSVPATASLPWDLWALETPSLVTLTSSVAALAVLTCSGAPALLLGAGHAECEVREVPACRCHPGLAGRWCRIMATELPPSPIVPLKSLQKSDR